ncbi:hypothetical protein BDR04DRAFT_1123524 [Suillus decipiens]|nr:hypothetical protein BDR04DRAFT_1123524 [Suillus decipiens]
MVDCDGLNIVNTVSCSGRDQAKGGYENEVVDMLARRVALLREQSITVWLACVSAVLRGWNGKDVADEYQNHLAIRMRGSSRILDADFNCSVDSGFVDTGFVYITTDDPPDIPSISATHTPRLSSHERIKPAVKILRDGRISIIDFMLTILDPSELDFAYSRDWIYNCSKQEKESVNGRGNKGKLEKMFDRLFADSRGRARILERFHPLVMPYFIDS